MVPVLWNWFTLTSATFLSSPITNDNMLSPLSMTFPLLPPFILFLLSQTPSVFFRSFGSGQNIFCLANSFVYIWIVEENLGQMSFLCLFARKALNSSFLCLILLNRMDELKGLIEQWLRRLKLCDMPLVFLPTCGNLH